MKTRLHLKTDGNHEVLLGDMDISTAVFAINIEADALSIPTVTLTIQGEVEISADGASVMLQYPHEVQKLFKGRAYEDEEDG